MSRANMGITVAKAAAFLKGHRRLILLACAGLLVAASIATYAKLTRLVEQRLNEGVFASSIGIYAAPKTIVKGSPVTQEALITALRRAGYSDKADTGATGQFQVVNNAVTIVPGPASYLHGPSVRVLLDKGKITSISD